MRDRIKNLLVVICFFLGFTGLLVAIILDDRADKHSYLECKETPAYVCTRSNGFMCSGYEPETRCVKHRVPWLWLPAKDR